jgi:hypothetical protein
MVDKNKQYKTREGFPYRCYATDGGGAYPVHGAYFKGGEWLPIRHKENGMFGDDEHYHDLIEVKPRIKIERWVTVADDGSVFVFTNKVKGGPSVFAIKHIVFEVEEGEGLEHGSN